MENFSRQTNAERDLSNRRVTAMLEQAMSEDRNAPDANPQTYLKKPQSPHENPAGLHATDSDIPPACNRHVCHAVADADRPYSPGADKGVHRVMKRIEIGADAFEDSFSSTDTASTVEMSSHWATPATPVQPCAHVPCMPEACGDTARMDESAASREPRGKAPSAQEPLRELVVRPRPLQSLPFV